MEEKKKETITELKDRKRAYGILAIILIILFALMMKIIWVLIVFLIEMIINRYMEYKIQRRYDEILEDNHDNLENIEKNTRKED